ncbi:carph-isopro domain-containing protein [Gluconobacter thailandicus]|uniref:Helix-turn-helix domain-containing protein n=1 Tax=Gluconobacter thailandicus TaxID=257438 RepID=A0AAP9ETW7_GLUTH|nr:YdaS family helix-turn-helix protein [Gluconobacter thailandicus]QEH97316.1 helix-turn-helix domain-containing protein [Gluconobacter thailandicus]
MTNALGIIEQQGGTRPFAKKLGLPPSTVQAWKTKGSFPVHRVIEIEKATGISREDLLKACLPPIADAVTKEPVHA